jgi:hypothetical protein
MIKRNYIANVEVVVNGKLANWGTHSFYTKGLFPASASEVAHEVRESMAEYFKCDSGDVRIVGVFKL